MTTEAASTVDQRADFGAAHRLAGISWEEAARSAPTIMAALRAHAKRRPHAPYLSALSADGSVQMRTFGQLEQQSRSVAGWLLERAGVHPGDTVGILPGNDVWSVVEVFSLLRAGCTAAVLSPADPESRVAEQARACGAELVLQPGPASTSYFPGAVELPAAAAAYRPSHPLPPDPPGTAAAFVFPTSGSTASSKLVEQSHLCVSVNARAVGTVHRLQPGDRLLACLPIHHVNGMHFTVIGALMAGAHTILAPGFDPFTYPRLLATHRPRIASVVPSILEALLQTCRKPTRFGGLDYFVCAAAPLGTLTASRVMATLGARVHQGYGLTEMTNFSTQLPAGLADEAYQRLAVEADVPSVGPAVPGNDVAVHAADGSPVPPGETGEVCMRGHSVMTGYRNNPEATREAFRGGWFHSGDLGRWLVLPGHRRPFLVLIGRTKNIAKVRGQAVSLEEMERVLSAVPGVADAGCVALPHRFFGEQVTAVVVLQHPGAPGAVQAAALAALRAAFPAMVLPERVAELRAIPRTATGKLRRAELAELLGTPAG